MSDVDAGHGTIADIRQRIVPYLKDLQDTVLHLLPTPREDGPYRVLNIGTGTGLLVERLMDKVPEAMVHVIHADQANLDAARDRLAPFGDQISFELADYARMNLDGPFDAIVSELAANFLENKSKRTVLSAAYAALRRGGRVISVIQARGPTDDLELHYAREWERMARDLGATDADLANSIITSAKDRTATLAQQLDWMAGDGFENADCFVKFWRFAVVAGDKV